MKISWHSKAVEDLRENISHMAQEKPQNALLVLKSLTRLCDSLEHKPYKYPMEPVYNAENIRFVTKWSFKIIYRVEEDQIYILRVFNIYQNPNSVFELSLPFKNF